PMAGGGAVAPKAQGANPRAFDGLDTQPAMRPGGTPPDSSGPSGNPLLGPLPAPYSSPSASAPRGVGGVPILSDAQKEEAKSFAADYSDKEASTYQSALQTQASLVNMNSAFDSAMKSGGLLTP